MIETRRLKTVVLFIRIFLQFVLLRKIIDIYSDIAQKYDELRIQDFRKFEKLHLKKQKLQLDINYLNNCKQLGVCPNFLVFKLPNVSKHDAFGIRKKLLRSAINKANKQFHQTSKALITTERNLSNILSSIDFYILNRSVTHFNNKILQKCIATQQKKLSALTHNRNLPTFSHNDTINNLTNYKLTQEKSDLLKSGLFFLYHLINFARQTLLHLRKHLSYIYHQSKIRRNKKSN